MTKWIKNFVKLSSATLLVVMAMMFVPVSSNQVSAVPCERQSSILGLPTWYKYLEGKEDVPGQCRPEINASEDALPIGLAILEITLTLSGIVAVVMIFIGSFKYVLTVGEPDKATDARKTVINALIGMAIVLIAARLVSFLAERLSS